MKKVIFLFLFILVTMSLQAQNYFAPADSCMIDSVTAVLNESSTVCTVTAYPHLKGQIYFDFALVSDFNPCAGETPETGLLTVFSTNSLSPEYIDNNFGNLPEGYYAYAVRMKYDNGNATDWEYSNVVANFTSINYTLEVLLVESSGDTVHPDTVSVILDGGNCVQTFHYQQVSYNGFVYFDSISKGSYLRSVNVPSFYSVSDSITLTSDTLQVIILHKTTLVPFIEDWSSGSFESDGWQHDEGWIIDNGKEPSAPWVAFRPENSLTHYESALTSGLVTNLQEAGTVNLHFDMRLDNVNESGSEQLVVEVNTNGIWTTVAEYKNDGMGTDWQTKSVAMRQITPGSTFKIRFVAKGENSSDIEAWNIDNILLDKSCDVPVYGWGVAVMTPMPFLNLIHWQVPQSAFSSWVSHDKGLTGQEDAFGLNSDFSIAAGVYSHDFDMIPDPFAGLKINSIRFYLYDTAFRSLTANIWIGDDNTGPDSLIWSKELTGYTSGSWVEVQVDTNIVFQNGNSYYTGYSVKGNISGHFPVGMDTVSQNNYNGDYIDNGNGWEQNMAYTPHNWKIQTMLQGQNWSADNFPDYFLIYEDNCDQETFVLKDTVYSLPGRMVYTDSLEKTCPSFLDLFKIKAHWPGDNGCLSDFGNYNNHPFENIEVIWESVNENQSRGNTVNVFPNPAVNLVNVQSKEKIISVTLFNQIVQKVFEQKGDEKYRLTVTTANLNPGVYIVSVKTKSGTVLKKLIVAHP